MMCVHAASWLEKYALSYSASDWVALPKQQITMDYLP